jgi:hypothetical protein
VGGLLGQRERATERTDHVDGVVRALTGQPGGALAVHSEDELDGAAEDAARGDLVDRERAAQQLRAVVTADGDGDELPGLGLPGDAGCDDRHRQVGADLLDAENLALDLDRCHQLTPRAARMARWWSCSGATPFSPARIASIPCTAAASACTVVRQGTPRITAAVRIS